MGPIIVMGVSGCGKSTVGQQLAGALGRSFLEGDTLHPAANVEKMSAGFPLTDADREPWLDLIGSELARGDLPVISCSALKRRYRDQLRRHCLLPPSFVFLTGSHACLSQRMAGRSGHFMPAALLDSQLATLESPEGEPGVVTVEIDQEAGKVLQDALAGLAALTSGQ